jgi:hypothetical protein
MAPEHMTDTELRRALFSAGDEITLPARVVASLLDNDHPDDPATVEELEAEVSQLLVQLDETAEQLTAALEQVRAAAAAHPIDTLLADLSAALDHAIAATDRPPIKTPRSAQ